VGSGSRQWQSAGGSISFAVAFMQRIVDNWQWQSAVGRRQWQSAVSSISFAVAFMQRIVDKNIDTQFPSKFIRLKSSNTKKI